MGDNLYDGAAQSKSRADSPRKRGSGLNRSETVTIRLDPRLNYLCELAARVQRRTKSSFIESAVAEQIDAQSISPRGGDGQTIGDMAEQLWHVRDYERLIRLAEHAPHLMSYDEQQKWAVICENGYFWKGHWKDHADSMQSWEWDTYPGKIIRERVVAHWATIVGVASGEISHEKLPSWKKTQPLPKLPTFDDSDIPF